MTFEFENVPAAAAAAAAEHAVVRPNGTALEVAQHRIREKHFLAQNGLPVAPFAEVRTDADLATAVQSIGRPAVLKTAALGYDGKGQVAITADTDPVSAWEQLGRTECILEAFVDLEREFSVIGARGVDGATSFFEPFDNTHRNHILDSRWHRPTYRRTSRSTRFEITRTVLEELDYIGILCIEFFVSRAGTLLVNELAPRPHNSGHLTFDACRTSQFEQQVRAICGFPLGATDSPAAGGNGQPARRHLGRRRTELVGCPRDARREAAPLRKSQCPAGSEDGAPHGDGSPPARRRASACFRRAVC
ncbi:MAG: ATP-grasp domain-containing protein [Vicinamibacterales bacterium]